MRILMLNYEFPPLGGGAGNATYYLLKEFAKNKNLHIDLVTSSTEKFRIEQFSDNIKIFFLDIGKNNNLHHQTNLDLLKYSWKAYIFSKKLLSKKRCDLAHAFFGIPCGYIAKKLNLPYIISLRGSDVPGHNPKFNKIYKILGSIIKTSWHHAKYVIADRTDLKSTANKFYQTKKIYIIKNGVDCNKFIPANHIDNKFNVLFVGRLNKIKGIKYLLKGFDCFSKNKNNVKLTLVGEGPLFDEIKNNYSKNKKIQIIGRKNQEELVKIYQDHNIYILPSINEGMSNTLLEAMSSGLGIIATNTGGAEELISKDNGFIIKKENAEEIAECLQFFYDNRGYLNKCGINNRQKAIQMSWENVAKEYYTIYQKLCAV